MAFDMMSALRSDLPDAAAAWKPAPKFSFVGGHNDGDSIPFAGLAESAVNAISRDGRNLVTYNLGGSPLGLLSLREFVAGSLAARAGLACDPDEILIVSGSLQALDLVNQAMLEPGDTIVIEEATYGGMLSRLTALGVNYVGVALDEHGIKPDHLDEVLADLAAKGTSAKYVYTIPTVQNPTGSVMPRERREALLALTQRHAIPIFEDECYADLVWEGDWPPALRGLDQTGSVIHIGSFSKSLAPAMRLGYLVADWPVLSQMLPMKGDAGTGALEQMAVAEYFGNHFDAHLAALKPKLKRKLDVIAEAVEREFGTAAEFTRPKGGIFFWMRVPGVDTTALLAAAQAEGLEYNPGAGWSTEDANPRARESLRLCFALGTEDEINRGVAKLAEIFRRETGIPTRSGNIDHG